MSTEYREKLNKMINQMEEDAKQRVRRIRADAVKLVKKCASDSERVSRLCRRADRCLSRVRTVTVKDEAHRLETSIQARITSALKRLDVTSFSKK